MHLYCSPLIETLSVHILGTPFALARGNEIPTCRRETPHRSIKFRNYNNRYIQTKPKKTKQWSHRQSRGICDTESAPPDRPRGQYHRLVRESEQERWVKSIQSDPSGIPSWGRRDLMARPEFQTEKKKPNFAHCSRTFPFPPVPSTPFYALLFWTLEKRRCSLEKICMAIYKNETKIFVN